MSENLLKKEFNAKTVKRVRDLVTKKYGEVTGVQTGYTKQTEEHTEGSIWEENGKQWTVKGGIKQNITKLDEFKRLARMPLLCPDCHQPMKTPYDKKMYFIHEKCMDCVTKFEMSLKYNGKFEEYSQAIIKGNIKHFLGEYEEFLVDISKNVSNQGFISEAGDIEKWIGNNKQQVETARKQLDNIKGSTDS